MDTDNKPNVRVLSDEVTELDELGSHQQIADAVVGLIDSDQSGKCVALTGSWGSGKSSILLMMKQNLRSSTALFIFDAWAHERDPLHRSFLEEAIDFLKNREWIDPKTWNKEKEKLSQRREVTEVTQHKKPTLLGYLVAISGLFVPLGLVILSNEKWIESREFLWLGIVFSLAPIVVTLISWLLSLTVKDEDEKKKYVYVLAGDSTETITSNTYKTPDPTTIEFQELYRNLLKEGLSDKSRKLVIVVDNLDRLDPKNALAMWASMKTFLDHTSIGSKNWSDQLWLVVPFDPVAMKALWDGESPKQPGGGHGDLASSFIDKTFQVKFHIPYPVLTNWIEFFESKLKWALPDLDDSAEVHDVCRIFRLKRFSGTSFPTPREIKVFINRIGALYRQWHGGFTLRTLAMYAAIESQKNLLESLRQNDPSLISPVPPQLLEKDYYLALAAIHFNVPKEKAAHVLLGSELEQQIGKKNTDGLKRLKQVTGFADVMEEIIEQSHPDWSKDTPSIICWLANCLDSPQPGRSNTTRTWDHLCRGASNVESWPELDEDMGLGITRLLDHNTSVEFAERVLKSISKTEPKVTVEADPLDAETTAAWLKGCSKVMEFIRDSRGESILTDEFECPGDAETYYAILSEAVGGEFPVSLIKYMTPAADLESIITIIGERVVSGQFNDTDACVIERLATMEFAWPWATLVGKLETHLRAPAVRKTIEVSAILGTLITLSPIVKAADGALKNLGVLGHCLHHLHTTHNETHSDGTALCMYITLKRNTTGTVATPVGNSAAGQQVFTSCKTEPATIEYALGDLKDLFVSHGDLSFVFDELRKDKSANPLRLAMIAQLSKRTEAVSEISTARFASHEADFYNALSTEEYKVLVDRFVVEGELEEYLGGQEFEASDASLYGAACESPGATPKRLDKWLQAGLSNLTEEEWTKDLDTTHYNLYDLMDTMRVRNVAIKLDVPFRDALAKYRDLVAAGTQPKRNLSDGWTEMLGCLDESLRKTFVQKTIDIIVESTVEHSSTIELFGPALLDCDLLDAKKNDLVQKGFTNFVEKDRIQELRWFSKVVSDCPQVFEKCRKENKDTLKKELEHLLAKDMDSEKHKILCEIAEAIGVPIPSDEEEKTDDSTPEVD